MHVIQTRIAHHLMKLSLVARLLPYLAATDKKKISMAAIGSDLGMKLASPNPHTQPMWEEGKFFISPS